MLKETLWGYPSPAKGVEEDCYDESWFISPNKNIAKTKKTATKLLKFNSKKSGKENRMFALKKNPLNVEKFRINSLAMRHTDKVKRISPEKILDAPGMVDDFYLNLLDWSSQNVVAIALEHTAYLMDYSTKRISYISPQSSADKITSLSWMRLNSNTLAIGLDDGRVEIWDTIENKLLRTLKGHMQRVSSLSWNQNILTTGSLDTKIINHDIRSANHIVSRFEDHTKEVWGLKWSFDGTQLASGSNDNTLWIWDINLARRPRHCFIEHKAAVKALAWCPLEPNLLASGGGTKDKSMKFWNTDTGEELWSLKTSAQICSLIWSNNSKELVSSHGYEKNELFVWKYSPNTTIEKWYLTKSAELCGHESRVLHLALSPNGTTIASTAPDETLRFWKVFESSEDNNSYLPFESGNSLFNGTIR